MTLKYWCCTKKSGVQSRPNHPYSDATGLLAVNLIKTSHAMHFSNEDNNETLLRMDVKLYKINYRGFILITGNPI